MIMRLQAGLSLARQISDAFLNLGHGLVEALDAPVKLELLIACSQLASCPRSTTTLRRVG